MRKKNTKETNATAAATTRYSEQDLAEFRKIINKKLEEAVFDYEMLRTAISGHSAESAVNTTNTKLVDDISDFFSKEDLTQLAVRRKKYIDQLNNALIRIENKTYGICRVTGKLINRERLKTVPHTTLSMAAKVQAGL